MKVRNPRRSGFTLIELLVVIAIIAVLIGLLLPAVQKVREAAARMSCTNNLKQIGLSLHGYHDQNGALPPGCRPDLTATGQPQASWGSSWKVFILPFMEQGNIYNKFVFQNSSGFGNSSNTQWVNNITIKPYRCPSSPLPDFSPYGNPGSVFQMFTSYTGIAGSTGPNDPLSNGGAGYVSGSGILFPNSSVKLTDITDGTSNTLMVGEQSDHLRDAANQPIIGGFGAITSQGPHGWTMGANGDSRLPPNFQNGGDNRPFNTSTTRWQINQRNLGNNCGNGTCDNTGANIPLSSGHTGGANVTFGDGSVRFLSDSIPLTTLWALSTKANGEVLPSF